MKLGTILRREGVLTEEQLQEALAYGAKNKIRLGEALLTLEFCTEAQLSRALATQLGLPFVDLVTTPPTPAVLRNVSSYVARQLGIVPVTVHDGRMLVVAQNPHDFTLDARLRALVRQPVQLAFASKEQIDNVLERYEYYASAPVDAAARTLASHRQDEYKKLQRLLRDDLPEGMEKLRGLIKEEISGGGRIELSLERTALRIYVQTPVAKLLLAMLPAHVMKLEL